MTAMISPSPSMQGATGSSVGRTSSGSMRDIVPKGYRLGQLQKFNPQQMELFGQLFSHLGPESFLSKLASGDQSAFAPAEEQSWRDYQGALGEMNEGLTGMGASKSSGGNLMKTQAAMDFARALKMQRHDLQTQALRELFQMSDMLLGQEPAHRGFYEKGPKKPSFWEQLGLRVLGGGMSAGSRLMGGMF